MIDVKNYLEKKTKDLAEVIKAGGGYAVATKKFDPATGEDLTPEIQAVGLEEIESAIISKQQEIADLNALKSDIEALN